MTMTDPLGDMLTRIRNAQMRRKQYVLTPNSKLRAWVLDVLESEGYIRSYEIEKGASGTDIIPFEVETIATPNPCLTLGRLSTHR